MSIKEFKDNNGITLAYANIPDDYVIGGILNNTIQSEHVPFTWSRSITMRAEFLLSA